MSHDSNHNSYRDKQNSSNTQHTIYDRELLRKTLDQQGEKTGNQRPIYIFPRMKQSKTSKK